MEYLALPYVLRQGYLLKASLHESITYSVGLILSTRIGEMHFNEDFGCNIWEKEFSDLYTANRANIRAALRNAINKFEKRLYNMSVDFSPSEVEETKILGMQVRVSGYFLDDDKEKKFEGVYNLG
jgi:phage baseplate assembly protein W